MSPSLYGEEWVSPSLYGTVTPENPSRTMFGVRLLDVCRTTRDRLPGGREGESVRLGSVAYKTLPFCTSPITPNAPSVTPPSVTGSGTPEVPVRPDVKNEL